MHSAGDQFMPSWQNNETFNLFVSLIMLYAGGHFVFGTEFDELFEHKDLFGQVHYFLSALCSPLLIKRLFQ